MLLNTLTTCAVPRCCWSTSLLDNEPRNPDRAVTLRDVVDRVEDWLAGPAAARAPPHKPVTGCSPRPGPTARPLSGHAHRSCGSKHSQRHSRQIRTKASTEPVALRVRPRPGNTTPTIPEPPTQTHSCIERPEAIFTGNFTGGTPPRCLPPVSTRSHRGGDGALSRALTANLPVKITHDGAMQQTRRSCACRGSRRFETSPGLIPLQRRRRSHDRAARRHPQPRQRPGRTAI
jgi:hypothetical protein